MDRFVLLTGGRERSGADPFDTAYLFDSQLEYWIQDPAQPQLKTARGSHASIATNTASYVFGGELGNERMANTFERLSHNVEFDWEGNSKAREWT